MTDQWPGQESEDTQVLDPMVEALDEDDAPANGAGEPLSVLDRLRQQREGMLAQRTMDYEVPGTGGRMVLRLGVLPRQKLAAMTQRAAKATSPEGDLNLNADTLISACVEVLGRNSREEPLRSVDPDGETVRIDAALAGLLGLPDATRAREVLQAVFCFAPAPDLAIGVAAGQYMEWASAAEEDVDEEFSGE